jgi:hypothetical protein
MKKIISNNDYHSTYELSNSKISLLHEGVRNFLMPPQYETDSMNFGQLVHDCVLQPEVFNKTYLPLPEDHNGRTSKGKGLVKDIEEMGMIAVKKHEYEGALSIRERLLKHTLTRNILEKSEKEVAYYSEFKKFGKVFPVKCKPDAHDLNTMLDLKTTRSFSQDDFKWSIKKYGYHRQSAFYPDVFEASEGHKIENFLIVPIENKYPYNIGLRLLDTESTDLGRKQYLLALEKLSRLIDCKASIIPTELKEMSQVLKFMNDNAELFDEELSISTTGLPSSSFYAEDI